MNCSLPLNSLISWSSLERRATNTRQNTQDLAKWLDAKYYISNYKPVPIEEFLVYENRIYSTSEATSGLEGIDHGGSSQARQSLRESTKPVRLIEPSKCAELRTHSANSVVSLTLETVEKGYGTLIFCSSRLGCQNTAALLAQAMPSEVSPDVLEGRKEVLDNLRALMVVPLDSTLETTIPYGVAFHRKSKIECITRSELANDNHRCGPDDRRKRNHRRCF